MDTPPMVVKLIEQMREDHRDRFDRLERGQDQFATRLTHIEGRMNRWAGAIAMISAAAGSVLTTIVSSVKATVWPN